MRELWRINTCVFMSVISFCLLMALPAEIHAQQRVYDPALYQALKYRMIGPHRGSRVTAVSGVASQRETFYMAPAGGGVWKTIDGGEIWESVSDGYFEAGSIGAITVADSDPNVIYVGTGSACIRGNVSPGIGMYKSTDAGKSWKHVGLEDAGQIGRIRVHPSNSDLVYVAVLGHAFWAERTAGGVPFEGWWAELGESFSCQRQDWRNRSCDGREQPPGALCRHVDGGAEALDAHLRQRGGRSLQDHRRGRHLDRADKRVAHGYHGKDWGHGFSGQIRASVGDRRSRGGRCVPF